METTGCSGEQDLQDTENQRKSQEYLFGFHNRKWKTNSRGMPGKKMTEIWDGSRDFVKLAIGRGLNNSLLGRRGLARTVETGREKGAQGV